YTTRHQARHERRDNVAADNRSWTDWVGKRGLHRSRHPIAYVADALTSGIVDSTVRSMNQRRAAIRRAVVHQPSRTQSATQCTAAVHMMLSFVFMMALAMR